MGNKVANSFLQRRVKRFRRKSIFRNDKQYIRIQVENPHDEIVVFSLWNAMGIYSDQVNFEGYKGFDEKKETKNLLNIRYVTGCKKTLSGKILDEKFRVLECVLAIENNIEEQLKLVWNLTSKKADGCYRSAPYFLPEKGETKHKFRLDFNKKYSDYIIDYSTTWFIPVFPKTKMQLTFTYKDLQTLSKA